MRRKSILVFFLLISLASLSGFAQANPFCGDILEKGIYDVDSRLDSRASYQLAKSIYCASSINENDRSSGGGGQISYAGFGFGANSTASSRRKSSQDFCDSNYDEYQSNDLFKRATKNINQGIVSAWSECITNNKSGVSHYITPSLNPEKFTYAITYTPEFNSKLETVKLDSLNIFGATCTENISEDLVLGGPGIAGTIERGLCTRNPSDNVIIVANASSGNRYLEPIELAAHVVDNITIIIDGPDPLQRYKNDLENVSLAIQSFLGGQSPPVSA